ncbi:SRPBCC family protein [Actinoallomurus acaciae]|uniref:SRPBCC family protein n=1 Tax=Actinoallomurus acaciae TaxID=502577 RepID=A0ABV5YRI3_9ACTN
MNDTLITAPPGIPQIVITRRFDAPRDLVFRAYTEPELLSRWLGPRDHTMTVERYEARDGGRWRYVGEDAEGHLHGFHGIFHGTPSPDGMVQTFEYEGAPGRVSLDTYTFEDDDGRTTVRSVSSFPSVEDRDRIVAQGMERGVRDSAERLTELLTDLKSGK